MGQKANMDSSEIESKFKCEHEGGTICLECATKTFNNFQKDIFLLQEEQEKLLQRLEALQGESDKPLCWQCKYSTCVHIRVPNSASIMHAIDREPWQESHKENEALDLWTVVCAYPGHVPGLMPNRFVVTTVLDCNNFTERKDKTKKSSKKNVK